MKIILHVGPGKTGSSSIQRALLQNPDIFKKYKCQSLEFFRSNEGDHHQLALLMMKHEYSFLENQVYEEIYKNISKTSEINCLIISSDLFANVSLEKLQSFCLFFHKKNIATSIVIVIRNLYEIALSTLQQQIKNGKNITGIHHHKPFTYFELLMKSNLLKATTIYIPYSKNITKDFLTAITDTDITHINITEARINESIGHRQLKLFNYFNFFFEYPSKINSFPIINCLRWAIMNTEPSSLPNFSQSEIIYLAEHINYDKELILEFLPSIYDSIDLSGCYHMENHANHIGFTESVLSKVDIAELEEIFGTMQDQIFSTDLINSITS
jgi:hypothetical protein